MTTSLRAVDLRVDGMSNPLGLGNPHPSLTWRLEAASGTFAQSAYRIIVKSEDGAITWDSGQVVSSATLDSRYSGRALRSRERCEWTVQVWDQDGIPSPFSMPATWEMGLLAREDWSASWLAGENRESQRDREHGLHWIWGPRPEKPERRWFRRAFELKEPVSTAELIAVVSDWWWWIRISGIWLDGRQIVTPVDRFDMTATAGDEHQRFSRPVIGLGALEAGRHVIVARVDFGSLVPSPPTPRTLEPAFAAMLRLTTPLGLQIRDGTSTEWSTAIGSEPEWASPSFDDTGWARSVALAQPDHQPWPATPVRHFRTEFHLDRLPDRARVYATGLGVYKVTLNGMPLDDTILAPGPAQYAVRVRTQTSDPSASLKIGRNAIGIAIADGWYAGFDGRFVWGPPPRRVLAQIELVTGDTTTVVATGESGWRAADGHVTSSELKRGEDQDARLVMTGWDEAGFDDSSWDDVTLAPEPQIDLEPDPGPAIRISARLAPVGIKRVGDVDIVDFGRDVTGWAQLRLVAHRGQHVKVCYAQKLGPDGLADASVSYDVATPYTEPTSGPHGDSYIAAGVSAGEVLDGGSAVHGFRYLQIKGLSQPPASNEVTAIVVGTSVAETLSVCSSSELVERIHGAIVSTARSALVGVLVDNASRETRGWLGDAAIFAETAALTFDLQRFTARRLVDIRDEQMPSGAFRFISPQPRFGNALFSTPDGSPPGWGDAAVVLAWTSWWVYGDTAVIDASWPALCAYMEFIERENPEHLWVRARSLDFGDWLALETTSKDLIATGVWYRSLTMMAQMARATGRVDDARRFSRSASLVRDRFVTTHVGRDGAVGEGTQTAQALALGAGLVPTSLRLPAAERLAQAVHSAGSLTTGIMGTQFLLDALADHGHGDLAIDLLLRTDLPSWGHMLRNGSTIWESWDGRGATNQPALGAIGGFLCRRIAGIRATAPGFASVVIDPIMDRRFDHGGGDYDSVRGRISTFWSRHDDGVDLKITLPCGVEGRIEVTDSGPMRLGPGTHRVRLDKASLSF